VAALFYLNVLSHMTNQSLHFSERASPKAIASKPILAIGRFEVLSLVALGIAALSVDLEAYIDPGTGSYLFQLAIAGALAALFTLKRYWHVIRQRVGALVGRSVIGRGPAERP
jgi:hypothetical protein